MRINCLKLSLLLGHSILTQGSAIKDTLWRDIRSSTTATATRTGTTTNNDEGDQVPMEFPYQPISASSNSQVLMLTEFTLLQSEVDKVNQYLLDHHWTVSAIHNHWFHESPRLIFLHAQKQDNLDNVLK